MTPIAYGFLALITVGFNSPTGSSGFSDGGTIPAIGSASQQTFKGRKISEVTTDAIGGGRLLVCLNADVGGISFIKGVAAVKSDGNLISLDGASATYLVSSGHSCWVWGSTTDFWNGISGQTRSIRIY